MYPLLPLPCPHCGACAVPTLGTGSGQHAARASCGACGRFLKWVARALVEGKAPLPCVNRVLLLGTISKYGVTVKYATNGTQTAPKETLLVKSWQ
jgi:hypothetical protein